MHLYARNASLCPNVDFADSTTLTLCACVCERLCVFNHNFLRKKKPNGLNVSIEIGVKSNIIRNKRDFYHGIPKSKPFSISHNEIIRFISQEMTRKKKWEKNQIVDKNF